MDRDKIFSESRELVFGGRITDGQTSGMNAILDAWDNHAPKSDPRFIAYSLATPYWETMKTMQPIDELGHGRGRPYGVPDRATGKAYYGRGLVQLTWGYNYKHATARLLAHGVIDKSKDLYQNPELAKEPDIAAAVLVFGMLEGWFSGRKLADYFSGTRSDWLDARQIINGHDKAAIIAGFGMHFYHALTA